MPTLKPSWGVKIRGVLDFVRRGGAPSACAGIGPMAALICAAVMEYEEGFFFTGRSLCLNRTLTQDYFGSASTLSMIFFCQQ